MSVEQDGHTEVLVFGSAIVDFICYVERLPKPGETLHGNKFSTGFGGKGANQCVAAARLGARAALIAKVGEDSWGSNYIRQLRKELINAEFVQQCSGETTGIAQIAVSAEGENHIIIVTGANKLLSSDDVKRAQMLFGSAKVLLCQFETPVEATLEALRSFRGVSILNAAPALANTPKELLRAASIFCVNETEAALTIGCEGIDSLGQAKRAAGRLVQMGANTVMITMGSQGVVYVQREAPSDCVHVPAHDVRKVVDTTGAGDAFLGALAYFIARYPQVALHQQVGAACAVAAYAVQYPGTQSSFPSSKDIHLDLLDPKKEFKWQYI